MPCYFKKAEDIIIMTWYAFILIFGGHISHEEALLVSCWISTTEVSEYQFKKQLFEKMNMLTLYSILLDNVIG